jgi:hypothetical protein
MKLPEIKAVGDVASFSIVTGSLMDWLPPVAAGLTIIWLLIRIWETQTVRRWLRRQ